MNEEINDTGAFLQDFTAVSDWEILTLRIEEIIQLWKLYKTSNEPRMNTGDFKKCEWAVLKESIEFRNLNLSVFRYKLKSTIKQDNECIDILEDDAKHCQALIDLGTDDNDFDTSNDSIPLLALWYGLRDFVIIKSDSRKDIKAKDVKLLLSSVNIAVNNTGCVVPLFIQCLDSWQEYFVGICDFKDLCIKFDTIHLQKTPSQCHFLVGLLDIFKGKIASPIPLESAQISAKFTYDLTDAASAMWMQEPPDFEFLQGKTVGVCNYSTIPFGSVADPIQNIYLHVSWLKLSEDTVVDSQTYSDLNPMQAPIWTMNIDVALTNKGLLFKFVESFLDQKNNALTLKMFLDDALNENDKLSGSLRIPKSVNFKNEGEPFLKDPKYYSPLSYEIVKSILHFIFVDNFFDSEVDKSDSYTLSNEILKASQCYDLIWRLAIVSAQIHQVTGDSHVLAHIWYEFTQELRFKWDNAIPLNRVMDGFPNPKTCLLHQKMQMLNVCIERRKAREAASSAQSALLEDSSAESDDEFFECDDEIEDVPEINHKPVGRLAKFGNEVLMETGEQMYIPITQEPVPKTEDQLEEDAEVMLTLDVGPSRSETIARIMSASLLSDMESFKAANPGAIFEDFIRWYSPRDWIQEEDEENESPKKGHLSARMLIPENMWVEVWKSAKPVQAKRQKRLFDDTKEGEKILHFLESRKVGQIVELLLPSLIQGVLEKLGQECRKSPELPQLENYFERMKSSAMKLTRDKAVAEKYLGLVEQISNTEKVISQLDSIKSKLNYSNETLGDDVKQFLRELITGGEAKVPGNAKSVVRSRISGMFRSVMEDKPFNTYQRDVPFPTPVQKEFVLRVNASRPSAHSNPSLQMMRAIVRHNYCRILGAFTEDTVFT